MSYTHSLSIQGVTANLQLSLDNSIVSYTLTLRATNGEEMVTNGKMPQESLDSFVVINQHFNVPQLKGLDIINQAYPATDVLEEVESFSPILPTSPRRLIVELPPLLSEDDAKKELQACTEDASQVELAHPLEQAEHVQSTNELLPPTEEEKIMLQLTNILMFSNPDNKKRALYAVKDYITKNNVAVQDNPALCHLIMHACTHLINRYVYDTELVDRCSEMVCLTGESISNTIIRRVNHYGLFRNVARTRNISAPQDTLNEWYSKYTEWKEEGNGAELNRWKSMEHWLVNVIPVNVE